MHDFVSRWRASLATLFALLLCASVEAQFTLDREPPGPSSRRTGLVITEIMYHPRVNPARTNDSLEFVEVFNSKPWDEDISAFSIDGSVHYAFPSNTVLRAGAYLVVARQPGLVQTNYSITNVFGPWDGATTNRLPINGGIVQLRNRQGAVLLETDYGDAPPWPVAADGKGHSLVLARPSFGENDPRAWAESDTIDGSPGRVDPISDEPLANVMINEWQAHTDLPVRDAIELYNHGNDDVDLSGAYLTDNSDTNKFRIPNGTIIPPRGFRFFDDSVLLFNLFAGGETIYLINSDQTRVIDAIDFKGQSNNISSGRWPDGGPLHYGLASRTPGGPNSTPMRYAVVLNELMFNPVSGNLDDEYIELYNRSGASVNLAGWSFISGITYTFPTNPAVVIPPGGYFVVARNPTNLFAIYTNLNSNNTFGPYTGTLANGGERVAFCAADYDNIISNNVRITVKLNIVVSEVTYGDGGRWGNWADGGGASLELVDPEADTQLPSNWADSDDAGESQWTAIEYNGPLGETLGANVNDSAIIMLQGVGECLVDEVEVRVDNGANLVANGGFESGLSGWSLQGSHDFSTVANVGFGGSKSLHLRAGSRGDNQSNRILSAPFGRSINPNANVSIRAKVKWLRGHPEILVRLHGGGAEAYGMLALPRRLGTPGQANSRRIATAGPGIFEVKHAPILPAANQPVVVTARAHDPQGIAALTLKYRVDPTTNYTDVAMRDDGSGGDDIPSDGIYSATIPPQISRTIVAFYLEARDGAGAVNTFPQDVFPPAGLTRCWPNDAVARECVMRWGETQMPGDFPTYHLWLTSANSNRWHTRDAQNNTPLDGTFVYNNTRVVYNALPLYSGSPWHRTNSTTGPAGPNRVDYEMNFANDEPMLGSSDFILNNPGNADILTISDLSAVAEQTVYKVMEAMGLVQNHRRYVHFFVNGSQRSTTAQRSGNFIFEDSQQPNGDMIAEWFPDDAGGQLFKVEDWFEFQNNGFDLAANNDADLTRRTVLSNGQPVLAVAPYRFMFRKRSVGVGNSANDYSQLFALIDAISPADNPNSPTIDPVAFSAVADWEQWMRVFAVERTVGNWDSYGWARGKNDYWYRAPVGGFQHMTWDIDYSMGLGRPANEPLFESNDPRVTAMFNTPEIVRAYWRAFAELVSGPFRNESLDPFVDARIAALTANNVNIDPAAVTGIKTYVRERRAFLQSQLATVTVPFAVTVPRTFSTTNNLLVITGAAPVEVKEIWVNGEPYPVKWTTVTNFVMRIALDGGVNALTLQGMDRLTNALASAVNTLDVNYTGPVFDPVGSIVITEVMYAPSNAAAQFVEIVNRSAQVFGLSRWRLDGANFTFPVGTILTNGQTILLARNRNAFIAAYGNLPVFGVFGMNLSSQGQALALLKPTANGDQLISGLRYEAAAPWPTKVIGASLQLIDSARDNSRPSNWAFDTNVFATPGASNSVVATLTPYDPLWLNEVQTETLAGPLDDLGESDPWIELYNGSLTPLDLSAYFLATNYTTNLTEFRFPSGTIIQPGEHRLIWADGQPDQNADATNLHLPFHLDRSGTLALVRLVKGRPEITDYLTWPALGQNVSYGSSPDGQSVFRFALHTPSPRGTNREPPLSVFINEWMARNASSAFDPADNNPDDWIELYNAESFAVDLSGFFLSDDAANPRKYRVPTNGQYRIPANGFLLVWADNQPNQNTAARGDLHANFSLGGNSGMISLYFPDGSNVVDAITYASQTNDISEGRYSDGASVRSYMTRPTPRGRNALPGFNTAPTFPLIANQLGFPGGTNTINIRSIDPDGDSVSYDLVSGPEDAATFQSGFFRWIVPTNQPAGDYPVTLRVTDSGTPPRDNTASFVITVAAASINGVPAPVIRATANINGQATFTFDTIPGLTYRVFYTDDLAAPAWTQLGPDFVAANPSTSITDTMAVPRRFYRVLQME